MRNIQSLLDEYGESHQNPTNKTVHWICVPLIFFSIIGLFYSIPFGTNFSGIPINVATILLAGAIVYYLMLSKPLALGMILVSAICIYFCQLIQSSGLVLWQVSIFIFVAAWIGQFWGHKVEGKKPSFLKDIQFLMIGPAWLMHFIFKKVGIPY
jgi:uncharacterized membrane protein YGL010W